MKNLLNKYFEYQKNILLYSKDHINHNYYDIKKFIERCKFHELNNLSDIKIETILNYFNDYKNSVIITGLNRGKNPGQSALSSKSNSLRGFFKFCNMIGEKLEFNREQIPIIKKEIKPRDMMKKEEYELLLEAPLRYEENKLIQKRNQLLIEIPYKMGLRRIEVLRCKFEGFKSKNRQFMIKGKGGYIDPCFFSEDLREKVLNYEKLLIDKYKIEFEYVICGLANKNFGKQITTGTADNIVKKYSDLLLKEGLISRDLTLHMERHSFATNCVYSGLSQQATQQLMRHKDPKTTLNYYHLSDERLCSQFDKIGTNIF